jgi:integrase
MRFITPQHVAALAGTVDGHWEALVLSAAYAGLRWGELAGLRHQQLDLERRTIAVVEQLNETAGRLEWGPPKTAAGRRSVSIPSALAEVLAAHLERPLVSRSGLVFPSPLAEPLRRSNFTRRVWAPATRSVGLTGLRFHDMRHTAVALAIDQGAHPKAIQERMGHSSITVTLDRYGHLYEGLDNAIADGLDVVLRESRGLTAAWGTSTSGCGRPISDERAGQRQWG